MSTIVVELRSRLAETFGRERIVLSFPDRPVRVAEVVERLFGEHSADGGGARKEDFCDGERLIALFVANGSILRADSLLEDGDRLMIFPNSFGG